MLDSNLPKKLHEAINITELSLAAKSMQSAKNPGLYD